jgi:DNA repair protein RecO (recombination protein O)
MLLKSRGIVFRTIKYGETSVIADIFTEERGLHTFIGGGVRSAKARMPYSLFQPMTVVDLVSYFREGGGGLNRLKELRAAEVFQATPFDVRRGAVALFMAEICRKSIHEGEENPGLFEFLLENLRWLDATPHPIANIHLHFLLGLSAHLGFQPQQETEEGEAHFFDIKEGTFGAAAPQHHAMYMHPAETRHLLRLMETPLEECHAVPLDRSERKALLTGLLQFYQHHLPNFSGANTPEVLDLVF